MQRSAVSTIARRRGLEFGPAVPSMSSAVSMQNSMLQTG
jgi:hypothetical protein